MRLLVSILKSDSDCTNNGVSSTSNNATLIWDESDEEIKNNMPKGGCILVLTKGLGTRKYMAVPLGEKRWAMFGGNFIYTSDSRFPSDQPIHIHDRFED